MGWHPFCRCITTSILDLSSDPKQIENTPKQFNDWVKDNAKHIEKAEQRGTVPYFVRDNRDAVEKALEKKKLNENQRSNFGNGILDKAPSIRYSQENTLVSPLKSSILSRNETSRINNYAKQFKDEFPELGVLLKQLDTQDLSDSERLKIQQQIRIKSAEISYIKLQEWNVLDKSFTFSHIENNYVISDELKFRDRNGIMQTIETQTRSMMIFKDSYGREFAYQIGIAKESINTTAIEASRIIESYPPYLKFGIKRVSFFNEENPYDPFWRDLFNNPNHHSLASDGGHVKFWQPCSPSEFKRTMAHEAGHIIDKVGQLSHSTEWKEAIENDLKSWTTKNKTRLKEWGYVSKYAQTNDSEDFAESIAEYITNHSHFKKMYPNRAAAIRRFAQTLSQKLGIS